jgi:tetratricopeptide (TPR) repeat protein
MLVKLELALAQSYLFEGKYAEALKILKPISSQPKNNYALAQFAVAALHANLYRDARQAAQQLADMAKEPADRLRAMNLILALDLLQWRPDRNKHETDARALLKESNDTHAAALQNNLGVLKTFAAPPQYTAAQGNFNSAIDLWNALDQVTLPKDQHDPIAASATQNLGLCDWWAGDYEQAYKKIEAAQRQRVVLQQSSEGAAPPPADQAMRSRGLLGAALCESTLGRWQLSRNTLNEASPAFRTLPRTDPHRLASALLEARVNIGLLRYDEALSRCNEVLKDTTLFTAQHPLVISAKLRQGEALLGKRLYAEARPPLNDVLTQLKSLRWHEDHPEVLTYYRLLAQLETGEKNFPAAKAALDQGETARKRILAVQETKNQYRPHPEAAALMAARADWAFAQAGKDNPQAPALLTAALADWTAAEKEMTQAIGEQDALAHPLNGRYVVMQGYMFYRLGKYPEAEARLRTWETEFLETMPPNHLWSAQSLDVLVMILKAQNKDCKAEEARAKEIRKAIAGGT